MSTVTSYVRLTKPRVIELLLITTVPAMILAEGAMPGYLLIGAVLLGGTAGAGGANTINCYLERDRDKTMKRTAGRPLPSGEIRPINALIFGLALEIGAFGLLWWSANLLSAVLVLSATLFYVFVYTLWLKPRTPQNIVIGGAAGAVPVLVGWAAVTNTVAPAAWVMFAIIFVWTPPHFWALALKYKDDYAAADFPMLPVVAGTEKTLSQILRYTFVVAAVSLALIPAADMGLIYSVAAGFLGIAFITQASRLRRDTSPNAAIRLFTFSNLYLTILFVAIAADTLILGGTDASATTISQKTLGGTDASATTISQKTLPGTSGEPIIELEIPAPDFSLETLDGDTLTLSELRGRPVIVNFWASWCVECRKEFPLLAGAISDHQDSELTVVGVVFKDLPGDARSFVSETNASWPMVLDPDDVAIEAFKVRGIPQNIFIDSAGIIRSRSLLLEDRQDVEDHLATILP